MARFPIAKTEREWSHLTGELPQSMAGSIWLVEEGEYEQTYITAAFTDEALAEAHAKRVGGTVQEVPLFNRPVEFKTLFVRIGNVFPDGKVQRYSRQEQWQEPGPPALHNPDKPFDGHMQGHCGLHIYVSGGDRKAVNAEFQRQIKLAQAESTGVCKCGKTGPYILDQWNINGAVEGWIDSHGTIQPPPLWMEIEAISLPAEKGDKRGWISIPGGPCTKCGAEHACLFQTISHGERYRRGIRFMRLCSECAPEFDHLCTRCLVQMEETKNNNWSCPKCMSFMPSLNTTVLIGGQHQASTDKLPEQ